MAVESEIELPTAAELQQEQQQADPAHEAGLVCNAIAVATVGQCLEPVVELGKEVADGLDEGGRDDQVRPARRRW